MSPLLGVSWHRGWGMGDGVWGGDGGDKERAIKIEKKMARMRRNSIRPSPRQV